MLLGFYKLLWNEYFILIIIYARKILRVYFGTFFILGFLPNLILQGRLDSCHLDTFWCIYLFNLKKYRLTPRFQSSHYLPFAASINRF